jgi:pyrimidine-specific ribonucleoside hydrolase
MNVKTRLYLSAIAIVMAMSRTAGGAGAGMRSVKMPAGRMAKMPVIFDTDFGPDYDDVGAIALLHAFADSGLIDILATGASCKHEHAAAALSVFNTWFGRPALPVGIVKGEAVDIGDWQHWTDTVIARYPHRIRSNDEAPDAVALYRELLAGQPDHSVTMITVGFFTNMARLLRSSPDAASPLDGVELVRKKVSRLVSMAGRFPTGMEFNVDKDPAASQWVFTHWPGMILFSGFEIGAKIHCGLPLVHNGAIGHDPVKDVFSMCIPMAKEDAAGRMSWDETAVLIAVTGWEPYYKLVPGRMVCAADGSNSWDASGGGHFYVQEKMAPEGVRAIIDRLIQHQPATLR